MPQYRAQVSMAADSLLPRDRLVNTLYFDDGGALSDPANLAADIAEAYDLGWNSGSMDRETTVGIYEIGQVGPPVATHTLYPDAAPASDAPREVALCLSFYAQQNQPRNRGRVFLPYASRGTGPGLRPTATYIAAAIDMATRFAAIGGVDVDWCVYSRADQLLKPVTNAWVDNEWDTQRSRGLRSDARTAITLGEG